MKYTQYFLSTRHRVDRAMIRESWIQLTITQPEKREIQADGRVRCWRRIAEMDNRVLRVILLEDEQTVHNAFFDRNASL
jgi:DNA-binding transcriptional regulator of glucitol operon